jgi:hypothetical protein
VRVIVQDMHGLAYLTPRSRAVLESRLQICAEFAHFS